MPNDDISPLQPTPSIRPVDSRDRHKKQTPPEKPRTDSPDEEKPETPKPGVDEYA